MSKRRAKPAKGKAAAPDSRPARFSLSRTKLLAGGGVIAVIIVGLLFFVSRSQPPTLPESYTIGSVDNCAGIPQFTRAIGFSSQGLAFDTRAKYVKGLALRELDSSGKILQTYQQPSWSSAGYLGAYQRDEQGNIFLIPAPFISILSNPPQKANIVYRVDTNSGVMAPLVNLPAEAQPTPENSYGLLGLAYDCDTHSLYASSVFGSTYEDVAGRIFQIDPRTGQVKCILDGIDAFGVGVFNSAGGKRLYFGLARSADIYSAALDANGVISSEPRLEISLHNLGVHGDERARSIVFQGEDQLVITTLQFDFNLIAPTETQQTVLEFRYQAGQDTWQLVRTQIVNE